MSWLFFKEFVTAYAILIAILVVLFAALAWVEGLIHRRRSKRGIA